MQTNFHDQHKSLISLAIRTLRQHIEAKGHPIKVNPPRYLRGADTLITEISCDGLFCINGEEYPFDTMEPAQLLKLIDEVLNN